MIPDVQDKADGVIRFLGSCSAKEQVEVLALVMLRLGLSGMKIPDDFSLTEIPDLVIEDINRNGQTLANALARQALLMYQWINNG